MRDLIRNWQEGLESNFRLAPGDLDQCGDGLDCVALIKNSAGGFHIFLAGRILTPVTQMLPGLGREKTFAGLDISEGDESVQIQRGTLTATLGPNGAQEDFQSWESASISELTEPEQVPAWWLGLDSGGRQEAICVKVTDLTNFEIGFLPLRTLVA